MNSETGVFLFKMGVGWFVFWAWVRVLFGPGLFGLDLFWYLRPRVHLVVVTKHKDHKCNFRKTMD